MGCTIYCGLITSSIVNPKDIKEGGRNDAYVSIVFLVLGEGYRAAYYPLLTQPLELLWSYGQIFSLTMLMVPVLELIKNATSIKAEQDEQGEQTQKTVFQTWFEKSGGFYGTTFYLLKLISGLLRKVYIDIRERLLLPVGIKPFSKAWLKWVLDLSSKERPVNVDDER